MKKVQGNDSFQRMNYLYQISKLVAEKNPILSAHYGNLIISIAKKNVLKVHPDMKRQICKKCRSINKTKNTKIKTNKSNKNKYLIWTCRTCNTKKQIPVVSNKDTRVWTERPEAVVEIIH